VLKRGHKWADLRRDGMAERTEHMIKNRFKSLVAGNKKSVALDAV